VCSSDLKLISIGRKTTEFLPAWRPVEKRQKFYFPELFKYCAHRRPLHLTRRARALEKCRIYAKWLEKRPNSWMSVAYKLPMLLLKSYEALLGKRLRRLNKQLRPEK
jgi:hypothetical protein